MVWTSGHLTAKSIPSKRPWCKSGRCAGKAVELTSGGPRFCPNTGLGGSQGLSIGSGTSAEGIVKPGAFPGRRPERCLKELKGKGNPEVDLVGEQLQKNQYFLALGAGDRGEALKDGTEGTEAPPATGTSERPADDEDLMEQVYDPANILAALKHVLRNKGAPGVDGMAVEDLPAHLEIHWPAIDARLRQGTYRPQPVRRVEIPKPTGGVRQLGIPAVIDRLIQQAVLQVLQPRWDGTFSDNSDGFRPGRSAHQAVAKAQSYIEQTQFAN